MIGSIIDSLVLKLKPDFPGSLRENFQFPGKFGDLSCNIAFAASKASGKSPAEIAEGIASKSSGDLPEFVERVESKGGYVNFFLDYSKLFESVVAPEKRAASGEKVLVEFSNPNPCKAMHIGNSRTTLLGDSICEILSACGKTAIRANYYNDLGKQFAKVLFAVQKYGFKEGGKPDHELARLYVELHKDLKEHPEWEGEIQVLLNRLEGKDPALETDRKFVLEKATRGFEETYRNLGVKFDTYFYESDFREKGKGMARDLEKKGLAFVSDERTLVANLEKSGLPNTVLIRSDGTGLYITSDLALTVHRFESLGLDECVWVVGSEQNLHFQQLFKLLELLGYGFADKCRHMSYGLITLQGSKMSSRSGEFILLDEVVDEVIEKAGEEVRKRHPLLEGEKLDELSRKIGIGALKYDLLKVDRNRGVDFNPAKAVQFEGNTGPYIQYMAVRCGSILAKKSPSPAFANERQYVLGEYEKALLRKLMEFSGVCQRAASELKPNLICNYAFELATTFSQFYENCKVIGSAEEGYRIKLVEKTKAMLEECLKLLRIEAPEMM
ncbi:MAG: arginine--tRNA ligase [Candidatus Aenigmarchaeota archaeon]|nr:arginine--tRNA ligase [Candidatus Aenigmarchaeota archaeon]